MSFRDEFYRGVAAYLADDYRKAVVEVLAVERVLETRRGVTQQFLDVTWVDGWQKEQRARLRMSLGELVDVLLRRDAE